MWYSMSNVSSEGIATAGKKQEGRIVNEKIKKIDGHHEIIIKHVYLTRVAWPCCPNSRLRRRSRP